MKILVTRSKTQSAGFATALADAGFTPVFFPVIEIRPAADFSAMDRALGRLTCYDWVVFTSVNAVEVTFTRPDAGNLAQAQGASALRVAAIGLKTASALQQRGVIPDFIPQDYVAEAILPGLGDLKGAWILLPRAELAREALPSAISQAGGVVHEITVYHTLPAQPNLDGLEQLRQGVDWLTFTSSSTVNNFCAIARQQGLDPLNLPGNPRVACIGPITTQTAQAAGFDVAIIAEQFTTDGLVKALIKKQQEKHDIQAKPANTYG